MYTMAVTGTFGVKKHSHAVLEGTAVYAAFESTRLTNDKDYDLNIVPSALNAGWFKLSIAVGTHYTSSTINSY